MTKTFNILSLSTLALVGALFALPAISSDANASATSQLKRCQFNTKQKVIDCCEHVLRTERKPFWIHDARGSCETLAVCTGKRSASRKCWVRYEQEIYRRDGGGNSPSLTRQQQTPAGKD
jgi:hypothetical protein